jgi:hypothetical protein
MSQCQNLLEELDNHVGVVVIVIKRPFPSYIGGQTSMKIDSPFSIIHNLSMVNIHRKNIKCDLTMSHVGYHLNFESKIFKFK